jgi:hypothetical protein
MRKKKGNADGQELSMAYFQIIMKNQTLLSHPYFCQANSRKNLISKIGGDQYEVGENENRIILTKYECTGLVISIREPPGRVSHNFF